MSGDTSLNALLVELVTACDGKVDEDYVKYVKQRLDEELATQEEAYELIVRLAAFGGASVQAWAEDTNREPGAVLQSIAVAMYTDDET